MFQASAIQWSFQVNANYSLKDLWHEWTGRERRWVVQFPFSLSYLRAGSAAGIVKLKYLMVRRHFLSKFQKIQRPYHLFSYCQVSIDIRCMPLGTSIDSILQKSVAFVILPFSANPKREEKGRRTTLIKLHIALAPSSSNILVSGVSLHVYWPMKTKILYQPATIGS